MEKNVIKRARSCNWEEDEKRILKSLITEKVNIIENKDTSTNTNNAKKAAWQEILSSFNSLANKRRDLPQLITKWRQIKGKAKSGKSEYRRALKMTGGGPPPASLPPEEIVIIQALPNEFLIDNNSFDSDGHHEKSLKLKTELNEPKPGGSIEDIQEPIDLPPRPTISQPLTRIKQVKKLKRKNNEEDYEKQLYLIAKKSKERESERAEEIHKKRITIMELEAEYWQKKINSV